jgi:N-hydroxyarylamine O-acetyltransferase
LEDFAEMCHYHQTSPDSHFTRKRICSRATLEGRITLSDETLIETRNGVREERKVSGDREWQTILREHFGVILPARIRNPGSLLRGLPQRSR